LQAVEQWKYAVRRMCEHLPAFEETTLARGVDAIWGNVMFPIVNHAFLTIAMDEVCLANAARAVGEYASARGFPWMFSVAEPLATSTLMLVAAGLEKSMSLTYMETEALRTPVRPLPQLKFRAIETQNDCDIMSDLNSFAYGMPPEWSREACSISMWARDAYGAIACSGEAPVSTATVLINGDAMNVVCVATPEPYRGRGYAEAVTRHVIQESARRWNLRRTVLHATDAGLPVYERMGYQPLVKFGIWSPAGH
jgi:hypothetical protein